MWGAIEKLNSKNWSVWSIRMENQMAVMKLDEVVYGHQTT